jgi:pimeloyl-ACP methyl ester carboxylesterase
MALLSFVNRLIAQDLERNGIHPRSVDLAGTAVHYYEGQGPADVPTLVLLHGYGDSSHTWYQMLLPLVRELGRILVPDLPGLGFSPLPPHRDHLTLAEYSALLREFCARIAGDGCVLVGQSLGGALALRLAGNRGKGSGDLLAGLIAIDPAGAPMTREELEALRVAFSVPDRAATRALLARVFTGSSWTYRLFENDLRAVLRSHSLQKLLASVQPSDCLTAEEMAAIRCPLLLLWGESERLLPASFLDFYRAHLPPSGRLEVVPGWGHAPQMEHPDELRAKVEAFVKRLVQGSSYTNSLPA